MLGAWGLEPSMLRSLHLAAIPLLLHACSQGSSSITNGAYRLDPKDGAFWSGLVGLAPRTELVLVDQKGLCDRFAKADPCSAEASQLTPGDGTFLTIAVSGQTTGQYDVAGTDHTRTADLAFIVRSGGTTTFSDRAITGRVVFTDLTPNVSGSGRYTAQLQSGTVIDGTFTADACSELDLLIDRTGKVNLNCATSFTPLSCSVRCTCATRSPNTADCARDDATSDWSCTCSHNGERTKCTVPKTEANVCTQGNGCCDTSF